MQAAAPWTDETGIIERMTLAPRGSFGSREVILRCIDPFSLFLVLASCPLGLGPRAVSQLLSSDASMASETSSSSSSSSITTYMGIAPPFFIVHTGRRVSVRRIQYA